MGITIETPKDMDQILAQRGLRPADIDTIILSHSHFDHIGDLAVFPPATNLVVGPGSRKTIVPGYPVQPESTILHADLENRAIEEVDFTSSQLHIKGLRSIDFFGDGSFYLLETPGHAAGHMSALARTTPATFAAVGSSFVLLAGDVCHHAGALRPSEFLQLSNDTIHRILGHERFSDQLIGTSQVDHGRRHAFYAPSSGGFNMDSQRMAETLQLIQEFDADPQVFIVLAHDHWILDIVDLFPQNANNWYEQGWAGRARWQFLRDFDFGA